MSERQCPICERILKDFDFFDKNIQYGLEQCEKWWDNPIVKIPCCNCFKKMNVLKNNEVMKVIFRKCEGMLNHFSVVFKELNLSMLLSPKQYNNLKKWGFL